MVRWKVKATARFTGGFVAALQAIGEGIFTDSQRKVPVDTGTLKKSGVFEKLDNGFRILYRTSYAAKQEFGIEPGTEEEIPAHIVPAHKRRKKGLTPSGRRRRRTVKVEAHEVKAHTRVWKDGMPGKFYVTNAFKKWAPRLRKLLMAELKRR